MTWTPRERPRSLAGQEGAVIVEFAAIFVVFAMLLWGLITYGVVFAAQQSVTHATSDAARASVGLHPDEDAARARAADIFATQFGQGSWLHPDGFTYTVSFGTCDSADPAADPRECTTVEAVYDWDAYPVVPELLSVATPDRLTARAVVQWD